MVPFLPLQLPLEAVLIFAGIGLFLLGAGVREAVRAVRLRGTDPTPVSGLGDAGGRAVVTGIARRADRTVAAPFTGRDCLAYSWHVDAVTPERSRDGVRFRRSVVDRGREAVPFLLGDGTMARRSFRAAAVSIGLGVVVLAALAFLLVML